MEEESRIEILKADITKLEVDAIVNAAKSSLLGGGGVDGAIHAAGGPTILMECKEWVKANGPCKTGEAMITSAGNMPCKFVIHTVGPVWQGGEKGEPELLRNAYWNSLTLAKSNNLKTIAFPNISTGVYGYPKEEAAAIAIETVMDWMDYNSLPEKIIFVCFDKENESLYKRLI